MLKKEDISITVDDVEIITRHLCGGWWKCHHCNRIYCDCISGYCKTCGCPKILNGQGPKRIHNQEEIIKKSGGRTTIT